MLSLQACIHLFQNPAAATGAKISEFPERLVQPGIKRVDPITEQMEVLTFPPDNRKLDRRNNFDTRPESCGLGLGHAVHVVVIGDSDGPQTRLQASLDQLRGRQRTIGEVTVQMEIDEVGHNEPSGQ